MQHSQAEKIYIVKKSILPNVIYQLSSIPMKILLTFFKEIGEKKQKTLKLNIEPQKTWNSQSNLEEQRTRPLSLRFKNILQSYSIQNGMLLAK